MLASLVPVLLPELLPLLLPFESADAVVVDPCAPADEFDGVLSADAVEGAVLAAWVDALDAVFAELWPLAEPLAAGWLAACDCGAGCGAVCCADGCGAADAEFCEAELVAADGAAAGAGAGVLGAGDAMLVCNRLENAGPVPPALEAEVPLGAWGGDAVTRSRMENVMSRAAYA